MTRIDFYQVGGDETHFTCRLIDMIYRRGHQVYVHTRDEPAARQLDECLWTFRSDAFIPHALHTESIDVPVRIGFNHEPDDHQDVLVNLSGEITDFFSRFDRVAEVVPVDENSRRSARENYAHYKKIGYVLNYHQVD